MKRFVKPALNIFSGRDLARWFVEFLWPGEGWGQCCLKDEAFVQKVADPLSRLSINRRVIVVLKCLRLDRIETSHEIEEFLREAFETIPMASAQERTLQELVKFRQLLAKAIMRRFRKLLDITDEQVNKQLVEKWMVELVTRHDPAEFDLQAWKDRFSVLVGGREKGSWVRDSCKSIRVGLLIKFVGPGDFLEET